MSLGLQVSCVCKEQELKKRILGGELGKIHHEEKVLCNVFPSAVYSYLVLQHSCLESRLSTALLQSIFTWKQKFVLQPSVSLLGPSRYQALLK